VSAAIDTVREVTGSPDVNLIGFCAGGIITTTLLNHLAAGDDRVHSMSYAVTLLDFGLRPRSPRSPGKVSSPSPATGRGVRASSPAGRWARLHLDAP
jgi:hypothetical protein